MSGRRPDGDDAPARERRNAGLSRREEIAIERENSRPYGLRRTEETITRRANADKDVRGEYDRRH